MDHERHDEAGEREQRREILQGGDVPFSTAWKTVNAVGYQSASVSRHAVPPEIWWLDRLSRKIVLFWRDLDRKVYINEEIVRVSSQYRAPTKDNWYRPTLLAYPQKITVDSLKAIDRFFFLSKSCLLFLQSAWNFFWRYDVVFGEFPASNIELLSLNCNEMIGVFVLTEVVHHARETSFLFKL